MVIEDRFGDWAIIVPDGAVVKYYPFKGIAVKYAGGELLVKIPELEVRYIQGVTRGGIPIERARTQLNVRRGYYSNRRRVLDLRKWGV